MSEPAAGAPPVVIRPRYHVTAPRNWLNDPNGPIKHDGRYHLFYQYNPTEPVWGPPLWGHVSSTDLVHWTDHEPALTPRPDGPDRDGCWSGCTRIINGRPTIFYTGVVEVDGSRTESVCVAHGSPNLLEWEPPDEPIIAAAPAAITTSYHRDPFVFGRPGAWRMLIGSGLVDGDTRAGALIQYASTDTVSWTYQGVLLRRPAGVGPIETGPLWECPQLFRSGADDVLIFSVNMETGPAQLRHCLYAAGTLGDSSFDVRTFGRLDYGNVFYAPAITRDDDGRVLMWGWVQEKHDRADVDHAGALSLPRVVELREGRLRVAPASELAGLRTTTLMTRQMADGDSILLQDDPGAASGFELEARLSDRGLAEVSLCVGNRPTYRILVDSTAGTAGVWSGAFGPFDAPLPPRPRGGHLLRLFIDGSLIEAFLDDEVAITTRCYEDAPTRIQVAGTSSVILEELRIHHLDVALPDRTGVRG